MMVSWCFLILLATWMIVIEGKNSTEGECSRKLNVHLILFLYNVSLFLLQVAKENTVSVVGPIGPVGSENEQNGIGYK